MAGANYRHCDVCGDKVFYDANLNYDDAHDGERVMQGGELTYYKMDYLGDWSVLCTECAKTHRTVIVPKDALLTGEE